MQTDDEATKGLDLVRSYVEREGRLKVAAVRYVPERRAFALAIQAGIQQLMLYASHEFLSDLPNTKELRQEAESYAATLNKRVLNPALSHFLCAIGVPVDVVIDWPFEWVQMRAASYVHVHVRD